MATSAIAMLSAAIWWGGFTLIPFLRLKDRFGLAHELTHSLQGGTGSFRDTPYGGWLWESHANWMTTQLPEFRGNTHCSVLSVNYPHLYYGSSRVRYCNWQFLEYLKNRFGYAVVNDIWRKVIKHQALSLKLAGKKPEDIQKTLKERYERLVKTYTRDVNAEDIFSMYMNCITESYDPHTNYFSPSAAERFKQSISLSLEGIGARLQTENDYTKIVEILLRETARRVGDHVRLTQGAIDFLVEQGAACIFEETGELIGMERWMAQRGSA